jgi:predicted ATPase with chaperone activity
VWVCGFGCVFACVSECVCVYIYAHTNTNIYIFIGASVVLLHGPPGVGKTLTAEAMAENFHKPLYPVSMVFSLSLSLSLSLTHTHTRKHASTHTHK